MKSVGAYEAKTHLSRLLGKVARGERFTITRNGVPVALLIPAADAKERKVGEVIAAIKRSREGRTLGGLSVRDMIAEGRRF
ncbi:type II toxin-antitoxin system prevent-host-death family antitoxin [Candidatus Sumerlaeota bacterium]|nr:type II toxin-antitoxin system prevent-host-death family antitoxin [Candidatus Sumerlaeota bacterium]